MAQPPAHSRPTRPQAPSPFNGLVGRSIGIGACSGLAGSVVGYTIGVLRTETPILFAAYSSIQWFALGSTYYASRGLVTQAWARDGELSPADKTKASALAGGCSGAVGGFLRGPRNIIPGAVVLSLIGAAGQAIANTSVARVPKEKKSWLASKWSPMKPLSDEEYQKILEERLLGIEVDISTIDDKIARLKKAQAEEESRRQE